MIKMCDYCNKRLTKVDIPFRVNAGYMRWGIRSREMIYDFCLDCRNLLASFKKSTANDMMKSKHQDCCTALGDECKCCDYEHECLEDIPKIRLE